MEIYRLRKVTIQLDTRENKRIESNDIIHIK